METIELQLDTQTRERARKLAASRQCTLEELLRALIEYLVVVETGCLGMFADEPMLMDQVVTSAMQTREAHPLRQDSG
jgi:hypothetical protein